jgi:hypothetical protein
MINSDGFNDDPRTFMLNETVSTDGQWSDECSVFMVQGLPWSAVARAATPCIAWQVMVSQLIRMPHTTGSAFDCRFELSANSTNVVYFKHGSILVPQQ